jgi:hypothetical protein
MTLSSNGTSGLSSFGESSDARFDRPIMLSWEEERKRISVRDTPKKIPIPASPMNMKARSSAFEQKRAPASCPLAKKASIPTHLLAKKAYKTKQAIPPPPLADLSSSDDTFAETTVSPALPADESSICRVNATTHTVPCEYDGDACINGDASSRTSIVLASSRDAPMVDETYSACDAGKTVQDRTCKFDDNSDDREEIDPTSQVSQSTDSEDHPAVAHEADSSDSRFDRPIMLSWEEERKRISVRDTPKKIPIPESPMCMKARSSAFEQTRAPASCPLAKKASIPTHLLAKKAYKSKQAIPPPPLADFSSSDDTFAETAVSPSLSADESSICRVNAITHTVPCEYDGDACISNGDASPRTSIISASSSDAPMVDDTSVQERTCKFDDNSDDREEIDPTSQVSQSTDSEEHPAVAHEADSPDSRFDRPIMLSWEEERKRISLRDTPKKISIPESPLNMKARMSAFEQKRVAASCLLDSNL